MTKKLMATVLAAALAMTSISAAPAMAKPNDGVRILQGLAALYIISRVVQDSNDHRPEATPTRRDHRPTSNRIRDHRPTGHRTRDHRPKVDLPRGCLRSFYAGHHEVRAYGVRCINKHAPHLSLPLQCKRRIATDHGRRVVFTKRCLRQHGYRAARR